jgi:hypothetical protein
MILSIFDIQSLYLVRDVCANASSPDEKPEAGRGVLYTT